MTRRPRALDLYCCAGGAGMGLWRAGFDVVGVDIAPQPHYPFEFRQSDAFDLSPDYMASFDFIWASPPCQAHTLAQRIRKNVHPDRIESTRSMLKFLMKPYCIENVVGAPLVEPIELCGAMFGLKVYRHRLFECSFPIKAPRHPEHVAPLRKMGRKPEPGDFMHVVGNFSGVRQAREAMGIDWMVRDELREAIPPAFSQYIANVALRRMRPKDSFLLARGENHPLPIAAE